MLLRRVTAARPVWCAEESPAGSMTTTEARINRDRAAARNISLTPSSGHRLPHDFFDGGYSVAYLVEAGLAQRDHPVVNSLLAQLQRRGPDQDQLAQLVRHFHHFVEADAALVASVVAGLAAAPLVGLHLLGLLDREADFQQGLGRHGAFSLAVLADAADEALRLDEVDGGRDQEGLDAHVHQARDGRGGVVSVERREDEVARQRGLDG